MCRGMVQKTKSFQSFFPTAVAFCFTAIVLLIFLTPVRSQDATDSLASVLAEFSEDDPAIVELIRDLQAAPIPLNSAERTDLLKIPFLSPARADSILALRRQLGAFKRKNQLRVILDQETYRLVRDFFILNRKKQKNGYLQNRITRPIEQPAEIRTGRYSGSALHHQFKIFTRLTPQIEAGFVSQKDSGEPDYFDYFNGYVQYSANRWQIILGSFYLHFGQGILFSSPFSNQKSARSELPFRIRQDGAYASLSASEGSVLTGLYGRYNFDKMTLSGFLTRTIGDARLHAETGKIIGLETSGYHRTAAEQARRDLLQENVLGLAASLKVFRAGQAGVLVSQTGFTPKINDMAEFDLQQKRRQYFQFSGNRIWQYALFHRLKYNGLETCGEIAFAGSRSPAFSQSLFVRQGRIRAGLRAWRVPDNFQSPQGRIFDDLTPFPRARQGFYLALGLRPWRRASIDAYKYFSTDTWRTYFNPLPLQKSEWLVQAALQLRSTHLVMRYRKKNNQALPDDKNLEKTRRTIERDYIRLEVLFKVARDLRLRSRWEYTRQHSGNTRGTAVFQDIQYRYKKGLVINGRITFFETSNYDSRLYEYESDLPGSFANYPFYGRGFRWYVLIKARLPGHLTCWLKLRYHYLAWPASATSYHDQDHLRRMIRFQFQYDF